MIARHEVTQDKQDIWSKLSAKLPAGAMSWRQDGKPTQRNGAHFARFVGYIEANTVRERLDSLVPGEWDLTLELLPTLPGVGEAAFNKDTLCAFKARLQILGVIREDIGVGKDYKQASTDAFKRVAVRFGIGHELYDLEQNWVKVDGDGRYAKPLEDPQEAYDRRYGKGGTPAPAARPAREERPAVLQAPADPPAGEPFISADEDPIGAPPPIDPATVTCPKCGGKCWDNRVGKRNPRSPDFKCRDKTCDGVIWPAKGGSAKAAPKKPEPAAVALVESGDFEDFEDDQDSIPF